MTLAATLERSRHDREDWRYTDLEKILASSFAPKPAAKVASGNASAKQALADLNLRRDNVCRLVFINGAWQADLSEFASLSRDIVSDDARQGFRLAFADQACLVTTPIELVFINDGRAAETSTTLTIDIGASASLTITEHHVSTAAATQILDAEIRLGPQAKLEHNKILHANTRAAHLARTEAQVGAGAYYRNFALIKDTKLVRNEIEVTLQDRRAQCALNGVMLLRGEEHADTFTRITHAAPHGTSRQFYKSVVAGRAKCAFQGKITVAKNAQKTDGRQMSRALLLSDQAEMNAKPELEIHADDVTCSHGSTVGDLDTEALFYLRTRGLSLAEARALLLRGFVNEVINQTAESQNHDGGIRAVAERWLDEQR